MLHAIRRYIDQLEAVRSRAASEAAKVKRAPERMAANELRRKEVRRE